MAHSAIDTVVGVRELYVAVGAGDCMLVDVFGLLRRVAAAALALDYRSAQVRFHAGSGMATGALDVSGKLRLNSVSFKFVAVAAVRAEAVGIGARFCIFVPCMRKICKDGAHWQQVGLVACPGVALGAE
jgi:hypothetical protein